MTIVGPPPAPTNLTATVNGDGSVTLSWEAPDDDSITGYQILRRRPTEGEDTLLVYVEEAVRKAIAEMPQPEAGLSRAEVEKIVQAAIAAIPAQRAGLTNTDAERIARGVVASIPPKSAPAEYTKFFVNNAISKYETQGLDATLDYYNREESVDGQWYVLIIDENDLVIGHPDPDRLGLDLNG